MSAVCSDTSKALSPYVVDDALVKVLQLFHNVLHSLGLLPVDSLLELVSLETADILNICCECRTTFAINAEFYCYMFCIKINLVLCLFT